MRILDVKNLKTQSIFSSTDEKVFEFLHIVEREREREKERERERENLF